jgi:hypothetical protein
MRKGSPAEYGASFKLAINYGWLWLHACRTYVNLTQSCYSLDNRREGGRSLIDPSVREQNRRAIDALRLIPGQKIARCSNPPGGPIIVHDFIRLITIISGELRSHHS